MPLVHDKTITIGESQLDSFGHLNNARYLELFEQARWDVITERGSALVFQPIRDRFIVALQLGRRHIPPREDPLLPVAPYRFHRPMEHLFAESFAHPRTRYQVGRMNHRTVGPARGFLEERIPKELVVELRWRDFGIRDDLEGRRH